MKIKKRFLVVTGYFVILFLSYLSIIPISNLFAKTQHDLRLSWFYMPLAELSYIPYIFYTFAIVISSLSFFFYLLYSRQGKKELKEGYRITSILSIIGLTFLIIKILLNS